MSDMVRPPPPRFSSDRTVRVKAARERMERVRQTAVTLAYSFTKTTAVNSPMGHNEEGMQLLI